MNIYQRHALALQIAAELAAENADLHKANDRASEYIRELETSRESLRDDYTGAQNLIARLTRERDEARKGWAEALRSRPLNSHAVVIGPAQE